MWKTDNFYKEKNQLLSNITANFGIKLYLKLLSLTEKNLSPTKIFKLLNNKITIKRIINLKEEFIINKDDY
jgi:hypothetical protein